MLVTSDAHAYDFALLQIMNLDLYFEIKKKNGNLNQSKLCRKF